MQIKFRVHAALRMLERGIDDTDVQRVVEKGETIKTYPDDRPYPSRLILGWVGRRPLHVVAADNTEAEEVLIITVYEPDPQIWTEDFRRKRP